jgi:ABC-type dipeptide/oligopeptide/nickel transport system ATPase subunit
MISFGKSSDSLNGWLKNLGRKFFTKKMTSPEDRRLALTTLPTVTEIFDGEKAPPQSCRHYFLPQTALDENLLVGREAEFSQLEQALEAWRVGRPCSVLLAGPQGCGKTALATRFAQQLSSHHTIMHAVITRRLENEQSVIDFLSRLFQLPEKTSNLADTITQILAAPPCVAVIDGGHNLLLRSIGRREVGELFFSVLMATHRRHLWLLTCGHWPWENLCRHFSAANYFTQQIHLVHLDATNQRQALERRLLKAGLQDHVHYAEPTTEKIQIAKDQEDAARKFYQQLALVAGGNLQSVLYFWLLSCRFDTAQKQLVLLPPESMDLDFLHTLELDQLLTLSEIAWHGGLSVAEHQILFRSSARASTLHLTLLEQYRLLVQGAPDADNTEEALCYKLNPITEAAVVTRLRQLNLLY